MHLLPARLGLSIPDDLLELALTHPSIMRQGETLERTLKSNQRLEFLGDSLIDAFVADYFYREFPASPEGELTARKIACVRRESLADAARRIDLGQQIIFSPAEAKAGGANRDSNLSDAFEALVGAIFLANSWEITRAFVLKILEPELNRELSTLVPVKNLLQERSQAMGLGTPIYKTARTSAKRNYFSSEVFLMDEKCGRGQGNSKKSAEEAAAQVALESLNP